MLNKPIMINVYFGLLKYIRVYGSLAVAFGSFREN